MTDYIHTQKRIPPLKELSLNLRIQEETPSTTLVPLETNHPYCPGPTPPELGLPKVVTTQATVYGIDYVKKGVSVAVKECPGCSNIVRFHEYSSRFHNCNNSVLLTLPSCELLLSGLAVGQLPKEIIFKQKSNLNMSVTLFSFRLFAQTTELKCISMTLLVCFLTEQDNKWTHAGHLELFQRQSLPPSNYKKSFSSLPVTYRLWLSVFMLPVWLPPTCVNSGCQLEIGI
nr:uncharacterized protein LOC129163071 isoform X1 [Nothobranchius furzeri]